MGPELRPMWAGQTGELLDVRVQWAQACGQKGRGQGVGLQSGGACGLGDKVGKVRGDCEPGRCWGRGLAGAGVG